MASEETKIKCFRPLYFFKCPRLVEHCIQVLWSNSNVSLFSFMLELLGTRTYPVRYLTVLRHLLSSSIMSLLSIALAVTVYMFILLPKLLVL